MTRFRWVLLAIAVGGAVVVAAPSAQAACHAFTVKAAPEKVAEGGKVTVTVERDANVNPSSVDVSSVDVTAKAGMDYPAQKRTISFTAETELSFEIPTSDDSASEGDETFRLHLSNPSGCPVNQRFSLGRDATVTILSNDAAAPAPQPTTAPPTTRPSPSTTSTPDETTIPPSTSIAPSVSAPDTGVTSSSSSTTTTVEDRGDQALAGDAGDDDDDDDDGADGGLIVAAVLAVAALAGAGSILFRRWAATR